MFYMHAITKFQKGPHNKIEIISRAYTFFMKPFKGFVSKEPLLMFVMVALTMNKTSNNRNFSQSFKVGTS